MINKFNLNIKNIKHNGDEVLVMKLNKKIIYDRERFSIKYTVVNKNVYLNQKSESGWYIGLPRIYTDETHFNYDYVDVNG
jgi:hypothetical protein